MILLVQSSFIVSYRFGLGRICLMSSVELLFLQIGREMIDLGLGWGQRTEVVWGFWSLSWRDGRGFTIESVFLKVRGLALLRWDFWHSEICSDPSCMWTDTLLFFCMFFWRLRFRMVGDRRVKYTWQLLRTRCRLHSCDRCCWLFLGLDSWEFRRWFFFSTLGTQLWLQVRNLLSWLPCSNWAWCFPIWDWIKCLLLSMYDFVLMGVDESLHELIEIVL